MNGFCSIHDVNMQERESKTKFDDAGMPKKYWGHMVDGAMCFGKSTKQPLEKNTVFHPSALPKPEPQREPVKETDWDEIARGKIRSLFIQSHIQAKGLTPLSEPEKFVLDQLVELAMTGK